MGVANLVSELILNYLKSELIELTDFLHAGTYLRKLKCDWKCLGLASEMDVASLVMGLKLTVFEEWTDGTNWLYACWYRFAKIKHWSNFFEWV